MIGSSNVDSNVDIRGSSTYSNLTTDLLLLFKLFSCVEKLTLLVKCQNILANLSFITKLAYTELDHQMLNQSVILTPLSRVIVITTFNHQLA